MTRAPRQILFVGWTRIGDAVMSTVALRHIVETWPEARLTIVAGTLAEQVLRHVPNLDRMIVYRKQPWNRHWLGILKATVTRRWDLVIDLRDSAVGWLAPSHRTLRFRKGAVPDLRVRELARLLGLAEPPMPAIWLSAAERAAAERLVPGTGPDGDAGPVIAIAANAGRPEKVWPTDRFVAAVADLTGADGPLPGARVLVAGGPGEEGFTRILTAALGDRAIVTAGAESLLVQAACIARCALYLGNDSGLSHVAAALGVPTVAVFGPTDPRQYAPVGPRVAVVGGTTDGPTLPVEAVPVVQVVQAARAVLCSPPTGAAPA
ncbi:MAG: hypothetical protein RLY86_1154 [Pseudomonadota bacterium]|jgi:lipopolysaccharide export system permease protein